MRILQLLSSTGFHGAESMTAELVNKLSATGVHTQVLMLDNDAGAGVQALAQVGASAAVRHRIVCRGAWDTAAFGALRRLIVDERIDVVHSHKYKTTFYALGARLGTRAGMVTTYHNWILTSRALRAYARLDKTLARFNDFAAAVSTPIATELRRWMDPARVVQIDNGIDLERFAGGHGIGTDTAARMALRASISTDPAAPLIGFVGRLAPEKALPDLLQALAHPRLQQARLALVGDGPMREALEAHIAQAGLGHRVRLLGHRQDTPDLYRAFDLLALPSHLEAFPMVLLEAMACARPVVATAVGDVARIVGDGVDGRIVPAGAPDTLAQALAEVLDQADRGRAWGECGQTKVRERFSSRAMTERYQALYDNSLKPL